MSLGEKDTFANWMLLKMIDVDVIFAMDWLESCYATVDCHRKMIKFSMLREPAYAFQGDGSGSPTNLISGLGAKRLLRKGCHGYLAYVRNAEKEMVGLDQVPVVQEFVDVFPEEIPSPPPDMEIEFSIDVASGTQPISILPYRMAPAELKELKEQLQDLLNKGFIRPSSSPWGVLYFLL